MGVLIYWDEPPSDSTFTHTEVYRSDAEDGTYSLITTQALPDVTYYDTSGTSSDWYKVRYKVDSTYSEYSTPIQGNQAFLYSNPDDVLEAIGLDKNNLPGILTINQVYNFIWDISRNLDSLTKTVYGRTEEFSQIFSSKYLDTGRVIKLDYRDVTVSSVKFRSSLESDEFDTTLTNHYDYEAIGDGRKIKLFRTTLLSPRVYNDIQVNGSYGQSTIPDHIKQLTKVLAAIRAIVQLTGGSFDDVTSYQIGEYQASLGEPYTNLQATIRLLESEKERIMNQNGIDQAHYEARIS